MNSVIIRIFLALYRLANWWYKLTGEHSKAEIDAKCSI
nr:MAG TPA: hypothetical protein [Caudoviricetes sp.]